MASLTTYGSAFETIGMRRDNGVLEVRLHTNDGPLCWSLKAHEELEQAFLDISRDDENEVVILTGTADEFSGPEVAAGESASRTISPAQFADIVRVGRRLIMNLLDIPVPVIAAVNGPARRHPELPLLSDIVLMSENALFQDSAHFRGGLAPGDGVHVVFPHLMGQIRASYFLLTAQEIGAAEAKTLGLANEVLAQERLMPRARELAVTLMAQSPSVRRATRSLLTHELKAKMHNLLALGLLAESQAYVQQTSR